MVPGLMGKLPNWADRFPYAAIGDTYRHGGVSQGTV